MANDRGVVFSPLLFVPLLVISVTLPRLRVRCPPQGAFLSCGLVAALRPPWHQAFYRHDLDHDEKVEAGGLWRRVQAKRRWKPNRVPIRRDFPLCVGVLRVENQNIAVLKKFDETDSLPGRSLFRFFRSQVLKPSRRVKIGIGRDRAERRFQLDPGEQAITSANTRMIYEPGAHLHFARRRTPSRVFNLLISIVAESSRIAMEKMAPSSAQP